MSPRRFGVTKINVRVAGSRVAGSVPAIPPPGKLRTEHGKVAGWVITVTRRKYGCGLDAPLNPLTWIVNPVSSLAVVENTASSVVPRCTDASRMVAPGSCGTSCSNSGGVIDPSSTGEPDESSTSTGEVPLWKGEWNGEWNGAARNDGVLVPYRTRS